MTTSVKDHQAFIGSQMVSQEIIYDATLAGDARGIIWANWPDNVNKASFNSEELAAAAFIVGVGSGAHIRRILQD
jgi:hypothetical protein